MPDLFLSVLDLGYPVSHRGKVRETIDLGDHLFIVTTDRISAFDCILPGGLPGKGVLLNQLSAFWMRGLAKLLPTHFVTADEPDLPEQFRGDAGALRGRWMLVRKAERVPIECVVRGYLAGSGWPEYRKTGGIAGQPLPAGLQEFDRLPEPLFTPTTKEEVGHDRPLTIDEMAGIVGQETARDLRRLSIGIYTRAAAYARARGVVIADTKFEFGTIDGRLSLIDEALTPDSSRFWPLGSLEAGGPPEAWDKQYVRDYLKTLDWDRNPPAPPLPAEVAREALARYQKAYDALAGHRREPDWA